MLKWETVGCKNHTEETNWCLFPVPGHAACGAEIAGGVTVDAWRNTRKKNDRIDALKLAKLSAFNQLSQAHVPERNVRQWRSFIAYRHQLVQRRTQIKNHIRAILDREGLSTPVGRQGWTIDSLTALEDLAKPLDTVSIEQLWQAELGIELRALEAVEQWIAEVERKLDVLVKADPRTQCLQTIPGVGPRMAEAVVAVLDREANLAHHPMRSTL